MLSHGHVTERKGPVVTEFWGVYRGVREAEDFNGHAVAEQMQLFDDDHVTLVVDGLQDGSVLCGRATVGSPPRSPELTRHVAVSSAAYLSR